jgi:glucan phosphoethanolaminetransferase (alkaline phosphatase superfamily)
MRTLAPHIPTFTRSQKDIVVMEVLRKQLLRGLFIFMIVSNVFLFLRIFLRLLGADPANPFAAFIFALSGLFMLPFFGIFPQFRDQIAPGQMTVDISAFAAGFCYNVLIISAMIVVQVIFSIMRTKRQEKESVEKDKPINEGPIDRTFGHN